MTTYNVGPVRKHVQAAADELGTAFRVKTVGGFRAYNDGGFHFQGRALDFMCTPEQGARLSQHAWNNRNELGIIEVIWQQRIITTARAGEGWRKMGDRGSPTQNHMDHVHVSFNADGGSDQHNRNKDANGPIGKVVNVASELVPAVGEQVVTAGSGLLTGIDAIGGFFGTLGQRATWIRILQVIGGAGLVVGGVVIVGKGTVIGAAAEALPPIAGKVVKAAAGVATPK